MVMRFPLRRALLLVLLAIVSTTAFAAAVINVETDRNPVPVDESFRIIFETPDDVDGDPDFSPLDHDFRILSTSQATNISIINGSTTRSHKWMVNVLARHEGKLVIPPIRFGSDRSLAASVTVSGAGSAGNGQQAQSGDVFIEVEAKPLQPYVQAQIIYTVRLYRAVDTVNASLSDPEVTTGKAVIEKLGPDRPYQTRVTGRTYDVVERSYAVYPQSSGTLTISPIQFQGQVGQGPFSLFDPFGPQPRTIVRQSAPVSLKVLPIPASFSGRDWIPAAQFRISDAWAQEPPSFRVGEPVTRRITLTANGLTSGQLPELPAWAPDGVKTYPDKPDLKDSKSPLGVIGTRREETAIIPSHAGEITLPAIRIPWWNTDTDRMEMAVLPERKIQVLPAAGTQGAGNAPAAAAQAAQTAPGTGAAKSAAPPAAAPAGGRLSRALSTGTIPWKWISLLLAAGWLLTILILRRRRARGGTATPSSSAQALVAEIRRACAENDARLAKDALLRWGRYRWPDDPPASIGVLESRCTAELARELAQLNNALYSRAAGGWAGETLWRAFKAEPKEANRKTAKQDGGLEPLFKIR